MEVFLGLSATGWNAVSALATALAVLIAGSAAFVALRQLRQGRELNEEQARPYVLAYVNEDNETVRSMDLVIKNIGQTAARELEVHIDPPFVRGDEPVGHAFMDARFLKRPTSVLPPQAELRNFLDIPGSRHREGKELETEFTVRVKYKDRLGRNIEDQFDLDFNLMQGTLRADRYGVHHIATTLRAWTKN